MYDWIVFCDFNGTITVDEVYAKMLEDLRSPRATATYEKILEGSVSPSDGLSHLFSEISSNKFHIMEQCADHLQLSYGFEEFLAYMRAQGVPVVVLSGCPKAVVKKSLEPYERDVFSCHAVDVIPSGHCLRMLPQADTGRALHKTDVMRLYSARNALCIGDGKNDLEMAGSCDIVLAKKDLAKKLHGNRPYYSWVDFMDVLCLMKALGISNR